MSTLSAGSGARRRQAIASEVPNTLVVTGVALGTMRAQPRDGVWSFGGIGSGAYVMCERASALHSGVAASRSLRFGRTAGLGCIVAVEEDQLDDPRWQPTDDSDGRLVSRDDLMLFANHDRYWVYWSFDREEFMQAKARVLRGEPRTQLQGAITFEFKRLVARKLEKLDVLTWLREQDALDESELETFATHLFRSERGYVRQATIQPVGEVALVDVTPKPIQTLLQVEFLQWYALKAAERSGPHLAALHRACSIIAAVDSGAPDATMEAVANASFAAKGTPERARFEKYRVYAWKCAAANRVAEDFLRTLPSFLYQVRENAPDLDWERRARAMRASTASGSAGPAEHPVFDPAVQAASQHEKSATRFGLLLTDVTLPWVKGYFDLYTLGVRLKARLVEGHKEALVPLMSEFDREWEDFRNSYLPGACRELLDRQAPYLELLPALAQIEFLPARRVRLLQRYLDACALADQPWWKGLAESQGTDATTSLWKKLAPSIEWLGQALKSTGDTLAGLVQARLAAHSLAFHEAHELLEALFRHEIALSGTEIDPHVHHLERVSSTPGTTNFRAKIDIRDGTMTVTRDVPIPEAPTSVRLELLQRVGTGPALRSGPVQHAHAYQLAKDVTARFSTDLAVPVDLAELKRRHTVLPKAFATIAELINLTRAVATVADDLQSGKVADTALVPIWDVTKGVVAVVDSHQDVLKAMHRPIEAAQFVTAGKLGVTKLVASAFSGIDGALTIGKACTLLFSEEGDLAYELRQGRSVRAYVQGIKGMLQFAQGTVGILAAAPAAAALAATPVGLAVTIGAGLAVITMNLILDATREFEAHVDAFEKELDEARRKELKANRLLCSEATRSAVEFVKALG